MHKNPYAEALGNRDPLKALEETPEQIRQVVEGWPADRFEKSYAPGKWSARQLLVHLAQTELALPNRVRYALSQDGYVAQPFSQDDWLPLEDHLDARTALNAYLALRKMNAAMFRRLTPEQCERAFTHPEYGSLNVWWVINQIAGHDIHHLAHFKMIDETPNS